jgi:dTMP kinase
MGLLITVEGGEYLGKTTICIPGVEHVFRRAGIEIQSSREPGGTPEAEAIRAEIFTKAEQGASAKDLALLFNKARKIHLDQVIKPYLGVQKEQDRVMVLDRYLDSTRIYQGMEGGIDLNELRQMEQEYVQGYYPDITFILYIPEKQFPTIMKARHLVAENDAMRSQTKWDADSFEKQFQRQQFYLQLPDIAARFGEQRKFVLVDAARHPFDVIGSLISAMGDYIDKHNGIHQVHAGRKLQQAFKELQKEPIWMYMEKAWKKQQLMIQKLP